MMKKLMMILLAFCLLLPGTSVLAEEINLSDLYKNRDVDDSWDVSEAVQIQLNGNAFTASSDAVEAENGDVVIVRNGVYVLSGSYEGSIRIRVGDSEKVQLVLNGVNVTGNGGPVLIEESCDKLIVTVQEGTENHFVSAGSRIIEDKEISSCVYTEDDLSINGAGTLTIQSEGHGIQCKADLVLSADHLEVTAGGDGIRAKNSLLLLSGSIQVSAAGDGLCTTNTEKEGKGWIVIAGGTVTVKTGNGAGEDVQIQASSWNGRGSGWDWNAASQSDDSVSRKGIKAATELTVMDGTVILDAEDDGLHAAEIVISGGSIQIRSGDDGVHADGLLKITGSVLTIARSYEGLEGENVEISGGTIHVTAEDDGVNAAGGTDSQNARSREMDQGNVLTISGGDVTVESGKDGLDSNGSILLSGGVIRIYSPTTMGDGAIDMNGRGQLNGAVLMIASTSGVMQNVGNLSGQSLILAVNGQTYSGAGIAVVDGNGETLAEYTPSSSFDTLVVSVPAETAGTIAVNVGGSQVYSGSATENYGMNSGFGFGQGFGPGGGQGNGGPGGHGRRGW